MAGTITVDTIQSDSSYNSVLNIPSKVNFTGGMQIGGQDATLGGMRNRIINGDMRIDQRNEGAAVSTASSFVVDRWQMINVTDGTFSAQQDSSAPEGFKNSIKITVTGTDTSLTSQYFGVRQAIEGYNVYDFGLGTTAAVPITLSFWVKSSIAGTYAIRFNSQNGGRTFVATYTINQTDTWEQKVITINGDTTGTWQSTTGVGFNVQWTLSASSDYKGTPYTWSSTSTVHSVSGAVDIIGTNGATFYLTGVQVEKGSSSTPFEYRDYQSELVKCQRYCCIFGGASLYEPFGMGVGVSTTRAYFQLGLPTSLRTSPTGMTVLNMSSIGGTFGTPTAFTFDTAGKSWVMVVVDYSSGSGGLNNLVPGRLYAGGSLSPRIQFTSEL